MRASAFHITLGIGYKSIGVNAVLLTTEIYQKRIINWTLYLWPLKASATARTGAPKQNAPDYWITGAAPISIYDHVVRLSFSLMPLLVSLLLSVSPHHPDL